MQLDDGAKLQADSAVLDAALDGAPVRAARARPALVRLAIAEYDRTRPLIDGSIKPEGIRLTTNSPRIAEFCNRPVYEEYDVAEMSLSMYVAARGRGAPIIALPIFPLRMPVLGYVYCRSDAPYASPRDLVGKRIATLGYRYTVNLWLRGIFKDHYGLAPEQVSWVTSEHETTGYVIPGGIDFTVRKDRTAGQMLLAGEVDAIIGPEAPDEFRDGDPRIRRIFADARAECASYSQRTGIFPITHTVVMGLKSWRRKSWVAKPLIEAFRAAQRACDAFAYANGKHLSLPGAVFDLEQERRDYGKDPWPHGLPANRHLIETFVRYAHEQGYIPKPIAVDDLFAEGTHTL
jgi:4,5-dihydroxyphthalate decarboxylase